MSRALLRRQGKAQRLSSALNWIKNLTASFALLLHEVYGDPNQALFFGGMGIVSALVFGNMGAAYGTAKSGVGICSVAVLKPELIIKSIIPVVMAGILGIYGLIISVIISGSRKSTPAVSPRH